MKIKYVCHVLISAGGEKEKEPKKTSPGRFEPSFVVSGKIVTSESSVPEKLRH